MSDTYSCDGIKVLSSLEAIRTRPGMYIGSTDDDGVRYLAWEVIGNVVNEHLRGAATALDVSVVDGWIAVRDDGVGIPVDFLELHGRSALDLILTTLQCGRTSRS